MSGKAKTGKVRVPCEFCGQDNPVHYPKITKAGNHLGNSQDLAKHLMKCYPKLGRKQLPANQHPLSAGKNKNKCAEAHHLICCEAMKNDVWKKICASFGYHIDCVENGIMLPSDTRIACQAKVPLHNNNHDKTYGSPGMNYVNSVKQMIDSIARKADKGDYCKKNEDIIDQLNSISRQICFKVVNFNWTISPDGFDYHFLNKQGCLGESSWKEKETTNNKKCPVGRQHNLSIGSYWKEPAAQGY